MKTIRIVRVSDGAVALYHDEWWTEPDDEWSGSYYIWQEGNYGCDCNRELFFSRARGEDPPDEHECSIGRYRAFLPDGKELEQS